MNVTPTQPLLAPPAASPLIQKLARKRADKFAWAWLDTMWIVVAIVIGLALQAFLSHQSKAVFPYVDSALLTASMYLAALRLQTRFAAVAASLLIATNAPLALLLFSHHVIGLCLGEIILGIVGFAFNRTEIIVLAALGLVTSSFTTAIIGLVFVGLAVLTHRQYAVFGALAYALHAILLFSLNIHHNMPNFHHFGVPLTSKSLVFTGFFHSGMFWFFAPFLADLTLNQSKAKWVQPVTVVVVIFGVACLRPWESVGYATLAFPVIILMIAVGFGRLVPLVAGEYPKPWMRYIAVSFATVLLLGMQLFGNTVPKNF